MKVTRHYEFSPGLWPTLLTLIVFPLLLTLGFWQLNRADQKAEMQAAFNERYDKPAVDLARLSDRHPAGAMHWRNVIVNGRYAEHSYLLDNQVYAGETGYRVYTPLKLAGRDAAVLVERGWVALGTDRRHVPDIPLPDGELQLNGRIVPAPATGIMLAEHRIESMAANLYRVQRISPEELSVHSELNLLPYVVRLDSAPHAQDDEKSALGGFGRERHLGYAFQWFALAATLLIIYVFVNVKRRQKDHE